MVEELPPRARGRPPRLRHAPQVGGTTPACAGTTGNRDIPRFPNENYPRVRGDDSGRALLSDVSPELPPRARGRHPSASDVPSLMRTTPACAGTTLSGIGGAPARTNYPRVRGDDPDRRSSCSWRRELPPRARGRRVVSGQIRPWLGTTPACAGTTLRNFDETGVPENYPRVRGDDDVRVSAKELSEELPPRARGRHFVTWHFTTDVM